LEIGLDHAARGRLRLRQYAQSVEKRADPQDGDVLETYVAVWNTTVPEPRWINGERLSLHGDVSADGAKDVRGDVDVPDARRIEQRPRRAGEQAATISFVSTFFHPVTSISR
jgi:hypothetical protein